MRYMCVDERIISSRYVVHAVQLGDMQSLSARPNRFPLTRQQGANKAAISASVPSSTVGMYYAAVRLIRTW
jgi:hypothetical protein